MKSVNGGAAGTFSYNGDGKRVKKADSYGTYYYVHSSVLGAAAFEVTVWGVIARVHVTAGGKEIAQLATDGGFYWLHTDHLGTPRKMTNGVGVTVFRGEYDPHGNPLLEWSVVGNPYLNNNKFTGYERDVAAGLDFAQARHFNYGRGRFMQPDPSGLKYVNLSDPQSLNRYSRAKNDPVTFFDPTGLYTICYGWHVYWVSGSSITYGGFIKSYCVESGAGMILDGSENVSMGDVYIDKRKEKREAGVNSAEKMLRKTPCATFTNSLLAQADLIARRDPNNQGNDWRPSLQPLTDPNGNQSFPNLAGNLGNALRNVTTSDEASSGRSGDSVTFGHVITQYTSDDNSTRTPRGYTQELKWYPEFYDLDETAAGQASIHESLHLFPGLGDFELAKAAAYLNGENNRTFSSQSTASQYIQSQVTRYCN
jgi:RHS repeat-associated protein